MAIASPSQAARRSLGTFARWGAFQDDTPPRCYAIAEPMRDTKGAWRAFASIATWPSARVRGQLHVRLSRQKRPDARVRLAIGDRQFDLVAGAVDVWAPDPRSDAAIVAAMRSAPAMSLTTRAANGAIFADRYALKGAATAMDAAALGCARR